MLKTLTASDVRPVVREILAVVPDEWMPVGLLSEHVETHFAQPVGDDIIVTALNWNIAIRGWVERRWNADRDRWEYRLTNAGKAEQAQA